MSRSSKRKVSIVLAVCMATFMLLGGAASQASAADIGNGKGIGNAGEVYEVYPGQSYTDIIPLLQPGDELVFHEGTYYDVFRINNSGTEDKPIVVRGYGKGEARPLFYYDIGTNPCSIRASNITFEYMEFQTVRGGNTIRIQGDAQKRSDNITIKDCIFRDCPNVPIDANAYNMTCDNIKIINNSFIGVRYTSMYFGAHDGSTVITNMVIENNFIDGSQVVNPDIVGYGMELKKNVKGAMVRNNVILNPKGPGICIYGADSNNPEDANIVEGNVVIGAREAAGLDIGGGPVVVRNNLVLGCRWGGVQLYQYGGRVGMFKGYTVTGNTLACNSEADIAIYTPSANMPENIVISDNITISKEGVPSIFEVPEDVPWTVENNQAFSSDAELESLVEEYLTEAPTDAQSIDKVWPHLNKLKHGPFGMDEVKYLLKKLLQKIV